MSSSSFFHGKGNYESIPWVEKYRPDRFENIVLEEKNRHIFESIIREKHFPNLLFYGPPGGGKTTTIINLIQAYQKECGIDKNKSSSMIHLNASDDRGIDICRNQIYNFVNSHSLFDNGLKFIVLDEVDHMTKIAQIALKYMIQTKPQNVRFCLVCNYLSKIDDSLQNEFVTLRFNQLPKEQICLFLSDIVTKEKMKITTKQLQEIQSNFQSDIRSMINCLQTMQNGSPVGIRKILNGDVMFELYLFFSLLSDDTPNENSRKNEDEKEKDEKEKDEKENHEKENDEKENDEKENDEKEKDEKEQIHKREKEKENNIDFLEEKYETFVESIISISEHPKNIFKRFFVFLIRNHSQDFINTDFLTFVSEIIHFPDCPLHTLLFFVFVNMIKHFEIAKQNKIKK